MVVKEWLWPEVHPTLFQPWHRWNFTTWRKTIGLVLEGWGKADASQASLSWLETWLLPVRAWPLHLRLVCCSAQAFEAILGGETTDPLGRTVIMDNMETLRKKTWRPVKQRMAEPRSRFASLRIPRTFFWVLLIKYITTRRILKRKMDWVLTTWRWEMSLLSRGHRCVHSHLDQRNFLPIQDGNRGSVFVVASNWHPHLEWHHKVLPFQFGPLVDIHHC